MTTATATSNQKIIAELKATTQELQHTTHGNGESLIFEEQGKTFAIVTEGEKGFAIYMTYRNGSDWVFCPGFKTGKTLKAVDNFIAARL